MNTVTVLKLSNFSLSSIIFLTYAKFKKSKRLFQKQRIEQFLAYLLAEYNNNLLHNCILNKKKVSIISKLVLNVIEKFHSLLSLNWAYAFISSSSKPVQMLLLLFLLLNKLLIWLLNVFQFLLIFTTG